MHRPLQRNRKCTTYVLPRVFVTRKPPPQKPQVSESLQLQVAVRQLTVISSTSARYCLYAS